MLPKPVLKTHTYQDVEDKRHHPRHQHAEHGLLAVPLAVDEHQAHIFEVAHGAGEKLHQGVCQAIAGQHFHRILFDPGYASVESLETLQGGGGGRQR